jgi:hypothetical protein
MSFDAFNRRDLEGLLELLHPDVRVHSLMTEAECSDYAGHDGVRAWHAEGYWQAMSLRDGAVDFFGFYRNEEEALEALGRGMAGRG